MPTDQHRRCGRPLAAVVVVVVVVSAAEALDRPLVAAVVVGAEQAGVLAAAIRHALQLLSCQR